MGVAEDLDLDVSTAFDVSLDQEGVVAERRLRLASGCGDGVGQLARLTDNMHALAAAAGRRLDEDRVRVVGNAIDVVARGDRDTGGLGDLARLVLARHRGDGRR